MIEGVLYVRLREVSDDVTEAEERLRDLILEAIDRHAARGERSFPIDLRDGADLSILGVPPGEVPASEAVVAAVKAELEARGGWRIALKEKTGRLFKVNPPPFYAAPVEEEAPRHDLRPDEMIEILSKPLKLRQGQHDWLTPLHETADRLALVPSFHEHVGMLLNLLNSEQVSGAPTNEKTMNQLGTIVQQINTRREVVLQFMRARFQRDAPGSLYVRLPDGAEQEPETFRNYYDDLVMGINRFSLLATGESFRVAGVRSGSSWFLLVPSGFAAYVFVKKFLQIVFWAIQKKAECDRLVAEAKTSQSVAQLQDALAATTKDLLRGQMEQLLILQKRPATDDNLKENINAGMALMDKVISHFQANARICIPANAARAEKEELPVQAGGLLPAITEPPIPMKALAASPKADGEDGN